MLPVSTDLFQGLGFTSFQTRTGWSFLGEGQPLGLAADHGRYSGCKRFEPLRARGATECLTEGFGPLLEYPKTKDLERSNYTYAS